MKPLRDSPEHAEASALLRAVSDELDDHAMQQRIQARLRAKKRAGGVVLRPIFATLVIGIFAAIASAAALRWHRARLVVAPSHVVHALPVRERHLAHVAAIVEPPPATSPIVTSPSPLIVPHHAHVRVAPPPAIVEPPTIATPVVQPAPQTAMLQQAMRALRYEKDPTRAAELADGYLAQHPTDDLEEEALAITIEAHAKLDDGRASSLARRYLAQFPDGRFRALAERTR